MEGVKGFAFWKRARDGWRWGDVVVILASMLWSGGECFVFCCVGPEEERCQW